MAEKGLAMLQGMERSDALYFHKLAIALEKAGRVVLLHQLQPARVAAAVAQVDLGNQHQVGPALLGRQQVGPAQELGALHATGSTRMYTTG